MNNRLRILIVDDHAIIRHGLRTLFLSEPGLEVIGEAEDGAQAVWYAKKDKPDVILMDLVMPNMDGITATERIKITDPSVKILVLTTFADDDKVFPAIKAGASGYLLKDTHPNDLIQAIYAVAEGKFQIHPTIAARLMQEVIQPPLKPSSGTSLTNREMEVLRWTARGLTNQDIARKLVVSERTISTHISNILDKLHLANRTQAALYALREGLVDLSDPNVSRDSSQD